MAKGKTANKADEKKEGGTAAKWAKILLLPSIYLWERDKKKKTGLALTALLAALAILFIYQLIAQHSASFICVVGYLAVNVYCWLELWFGREKD